MVLAVAGCDYSGDFLFPGVSEVDDIWVLTDPDGEFLTPVDLQASCAALGVVDGDGDGNVCEDATPEQRGQVIADATIYAEVGPANTTAYGGVTVDFLGTGGEVCIWVDPELVFWNQAVADRPTELSQRWSYPDNVFDDGDLDLFGGLSVYYTGSPGESIGDFRVAYEDSLGNDVPISLALCPNQLGLVEDFVSSGRGAPDYCTLPPTDVGIGYTVLLRTWSTPLDDDRMAFGFLMTAGTCESLRSLGGVATQAADECLIVGESIKPDGADFGPFYGFDELNGTGRIWGGSVEVEALYCDEEGRLDRHCNQEVAAHEEEGAEDCWYPTGPYDPLDVPTDANRCYCGDIDDTPEGGAF